MSRNEDDGLGAGYWKSLKSEQAKNEEKRKAFKAWEADKSPTKPTRDQFVKMNGGEVLSETQLHERAKERVKQKNIEQKKLERGGLVSSTDKTQRQTVAGAKQKKKMSIMSAVKKKFGSEGPGGQEKPKSLEKSQKRETEKRTRGR